MGTSRRDHRHVDVTRRSPSSSSGRRGDVFGGGGWVAGTPVRPGRETSWRRIRRPSCRVGIPTPSPRNVYRGIRTLHPLEFLFCVSSIFFLLNSTLAELSFCTNFKRVSLWFFFFFHGLYAIDVRNVDSISFRFHLEDFYIFYRRMKLFDFLFNCYLICKIVEYY